MATEPLGTPIVSDYSIDQVRLGRESESVAVVIPVHNEATTLGGVLDAVRVFEDLIDELVVVDDRSSDDSAAIAERHGAKVVAAESPGGKGRAMAAGAKVTSASIVVFLDADVVDMSAHVVGRLVHPLLQDSSLHMVKPYYERPFLGQPSGGGRVNELAARPILSLLFPDLAHVRQPLAGETAIRRSTLDLVGLSPGYDVEIALLIDVARSFGVASIAQVDLGVRRHRNRSLEELRPMATEVLRTALGRFNDAERETLA